MSNEIKELQDEEHEVLISIYEGDTSFKEINSTTYKYKYGEEDDKNSFLLEIIWGENYPNEPPTFNLDTFYNRNKSPGVKAQIKTILNDEAQQWLGCSMTYTLFECLKERITEILESQTPETLVESSSTLIKVAETDDKLENIAGGTSKLQPKKEQLTKSQKRRAWEHSDHKGDRPRGYNWVDIVKHLSQTGGKEQGGALPTNYEG